MTVSIPNSLDEGAFTRMTYRCTATAFSGDRGAVRNARTGRHRISTNARFTVEYTGVTWMPVVGALRQRTSTSSAGSHATSANPRHSSIAICLGLPASHPARVYADVDPDSHHGVVITEDVVADGGVFLDGRSVYTPEQVAASLRELAQLHAVDMDATAMVRRHRG